MTAANAGVVSRPGGYRQALERVRTASITARDNGGRIVVLGEGMASLFLGDPNGETTYWGKDSVMFMEEVLTWLARP